MHTAAGVARSVALVLSIILSSVSGLANPVDIAASAHRHHTARRRRRAQYGAALALLIAKQYALDAEFQLLNPLPPLRTVYVRARSTHWWARVVNGDWNKLTPAARNREWLETFRMGHDTFEYLHTRRVVTLHVFGATPNWIPTLRNEAPVARR